MAGPHVAIGVPSGDMVHADFMLSLLNVVQNARSAGIRVSLVNTKLSLLTEARNLCVNAAQQAKVDWLIFLDSDMLFPADVIKRLLGHRKQIVGATYPRRVLPLSFIGTRADGSPFTLSDNGLVEAGRLPAGCLLIKMSVFEKLKRPYFRCSYHEDVGLVLGEDFWFSDHVRSLGIELWCDMAISRQIEHLGLHRFNLREGK